MTELKLGYGAFMPPLADQLKEQGLELEGVEQLEKLRHAIKLLAIHGLLPDSQADKCFQRLHKRITQLLEAQV